MTNYFEQFSEESEIAFRELSKGEVGSVLSACSDRRASSPYVLAPSISIQFAPMKFLILENEWTDTPVEHIDIYSLSASVSDRPRGIRVEEQDGFWSYDPVHELMVVGENNRVANVDVLEEAFVGVGESVRYDAAVNIKLRSGKQILIARDESISGLLSVTTDTESIALDMKSFKRRLTL